MLSAAGVERKRNSGEVEASLLYITIAETKDSSPRSE